MRATDEIYSIASYLTGLFSLRNYTARVRGKVSRPYFRIEEASHITTQLGAIGYIDIRD